MIIPIPTGIRHDVTLTGRVPKLVSCESCGYEYVYLLESSVAGSSVNAFFLDDRAEDRAYETAHVLLDRALQHGCAVVPCAQCGHVQAHMVPTAKSEHHHWMYKTGVCLLALGALLLAPALVLTLGANGPASGAAFGPVTIALWIGAAVLALTGIVLVNLRLILAMRHDPNASPTEVRKALGENLSVSKEEYIRVIQESHPPGR